MRLSKEIEVNTVDMIAKCTASYHGCSQDGLIGDVQLFQDDDGNGTWPSCRRGRASKNIKQKFSKSNEDCGPGGRRNGEVDFKVAPKVHRTSSDYAQETDCRPQASLKP